MILGGLLGAVAIPLLSDRYRKRTPFLVQSLVGAILGLIGIIYAGDYRFLLVSSFIFGFFLLSAGPIGFQYGAEITYPTPEGTSNGLLILMGQISGIISRSPRVPEPVHELCFLCGLITFRKRFNARNIHSI